MNLKSEEDFPHSIFLRIGVIYMQKVLICILLGIIIGAKGLLPEKAVKINSRLQNVFLFAMMFFMGLGIGSNGEIINNFSAIGFKALMFAVFCGGGSVLAVYILSKLFLKED